MNLRGYNADEINQLQKEKYWVIPLIDTVLPASGVYWI
jgi:hypothetical protein